MGRRVCCAYVIILPHGAANSIVVLTRLRKRFFFSRSSLFLSRSLVLRNDLDLRHLPYLPPPNNRPHPPLLPRQPNNLPPLPHPLHPLLLRPHLLRPLPNLLHPILRPLPPHNLHKIPPLRRPLRKRFEGRGREGMGRQGELPYARFSEGGGRGG